MESSSPQATKNGVMAPNGPGTTIAIGNASSNVYPQHYSIPPPHAHSLISHECSSPESTYMDPTAEIPNHANNKIVIDEDHKIKFTKTEGFTPSTCICVLIAILLISIGASSGIYYGLRSYEGTLLKDQVFKGQFTVTRGDSYNTKYEKRSSEEFRETAKLYKDRLDTLYSDSRLTKAFKRSEIIALEKTPKQGSDDLVVHFNLIFSPLSRPSIGPVDVYMVLGEEVSSPRKKAMKNITIDQNSIDIRERKSEGHRRGLFYTSSSSFPASAQFLENPDPWESRTQFPGLLEGLSTEATPPPRRCARIGLPFCSVLPYNYTSYPNIVGHWNVSSLEEDFVSFRQIVDAECYPLAREFVCRLVQPECEEDTMIWPCRDFCEDFYRSCKDWIPKKWASKMKCKRFPAKDGVLDETNDGDEEYEDDTINDEASIRYEIVPGSRSQRRKPRKCRPKPGCINELKMRSRNHHICDSVIDCQDGSDEFTCDYCSSGHQKDIKKSSESFFCGNGQCIGSHRRCDAVYDCNNNFDEKGCFFLSSSNEYTLPPYGTGVKTGWHSYLSQGILFSMYMGRPHKVCAYTFLNTTIPLIRKSSALHTMASKVCKQLGFRDALKVEPRSDASQNHPYVQVNSIKEDLISVEDVPCTSRQTIHVICSHLECGRNPAFSAPEKRIESEKGRTSIDPEDPKDGDGGLYHAFDGDWPWHAFLTKNADYSCDAILIDDEWILTSTNCFEEISSKVNHNSDHHSSSYLEPSFDSSSVSSATLDEPSKWQITLGSVRLIMKSPLHTQERSVTALMNSSAVDQLNLSIVRLSKPVNTSDYVRPVCLPEQEESIFKTLTTADCYSTFWDIKKDRLLFARAVIVDSSECINYDDDLVSRKRENHWCVKLTRTESENRLDRINGCPGCGLPGRPLYCNFSHTQPRWYLVGIESSSNAAERHHRQRSAKTTYWYSKVSLATQWVHKVIASFRDSSNDSSYII
ncbi:atrial natriuretic peptide-converting enzyme isoform X2 [Brevipalpus obovatus]|uniref:atrial natriuretic peptide-converting enzyme isoform X2 n=1 Tax=Brevipalpus obovatus TaxID=246614 RepID=UPI003D9E8279